MAKSGRKPLPKNKKLKLVPVYLNDDEKKLVNKAYGNATNAMREEVLPKLQTPAIPHEQ